MQTLINLYNFNLSLAEAMLAEVAEEEMSLQPSADANPPAWLLGHLAICNDFALSLLGQEGLCPESWRTEFGKGSQPLPQEIPYPSKDDLFAKLKQTHAAVVEAFAKADAASLAEPHGMPNPLMQKSIPTKGDLLGHLFTTHYAMHLGHLSSWHRQTGRGPLF